MIEQAKPVEAPVDYYGVLLGHEPKFITNYVPSNAAEQKAAFLEGAVRNPDHQYPKLESINFEERFATIEEIGKHILDNPSLKSKHVPVYEEFINGYHNKTRLMELAYEIKIVDDEATKQQLRQEYMQLNIELYGKPDEVTYRSLLQEKLENIKEKHLTGEALQLRKELFDMVGYDNSIQSIERFTPSPETMEWMHEVVGTLYNGMLAHVPERDMFTTQEAKDVFTAIITEEFGEAAEGWTVDIEPAKSINVKSTEQRIVIPEDRGDISHKVLRQLVVHEIGVHMLRSVMGGDTDLEPLKNGINDYYDAEEGLGMVMEQALNGKFVEAGIGHYITAGLAYYDKKDFRDIFEVKWRLGALEAMSDDGETSDAAMTKAKATAYNGTMRIMRGTDELPWFKDLSYYNGSVDMWRHLENIRGDDIKFMFVLMGKANPANIAHQRILYETATV